MDMDKLTQWQAEQVYRRGIRKAMDKVQRDWERDWDALWLKIKYDLHQRIWGNES